MGSVGELFIQLGVLGNANELKKANAEFQKANILAEKQAKLEKLRAEYLEKIQKAQTKAEKQELAKQYKARKSLIEQKAALNLKNLEQKMLRGNIAQWATYAHMVNIAATSVINSVKKINSELEKTMQQGQIWNNITNTVSTPYSVLRKYATAARLASPGLSSEAAAQSFAAMNARFAEAKRTGKYADLMDSNVALYGSDATRLFGNVANGKYTEFTSYLEAVGDLIRGRSPEDQVNLVKGFLGDTTFLPLLQMDKEDLRKLIAKANENQLTEEQNRELTKTRQQIEAIKIDIENKWQQLLINLTPFLEKAYKWIDNASTQIYPVLVTFANELKPVIKDFMSSMGKVNWNDVATGVSIIADAVLGIAKNIEWWVEQLGKAKNGAEAQKITDVEGGKKVFFDVQQGKFRSGVAGSSKEFDMALQAYVAQTLNGTSPMTPEGKKLLEKFAPAFEGLTKEKLEEMRANAYQSHYDNVMNKATQTLNNGNSFSIGHLNIYGANINNLDDIGNTSANRASIMFQTRTN